MKSKNQKRQEAIVRIERTVKKIERRMSDRVKRSTEKPVKNFDVRQAEDIRKLNAHRLTITNTERRLGL